MNKKQMVDSILTNAGYPETDRDKLMAFNEDQLKVMLNAFPPRAPGGAPSAAPAAAPAAAPSGNATIAVTGPVTHPASAHTPPTPAPAATPPGWPPGWPAPPTAMEEKKPITVNEYIDEAPKEIQDVLRNSVSIYEEEKTKLIEGILLNKNHSFTKEELSSRPLGELRNLARLAGGPARVPIYSGMAPAPTDNTEVEEPLLMPTINFGKEKQPATAAA